jgi:hypothetical protein
MKCDSIMGLILTVNSLNWRKVERARNDHILNVDGCTHSEVFTKFTKVDMYLQKL